MSNAGSLKFLLSERLPGSPGLIGLSVNGTGPTPGTIDADDDATMPFSNLWDRDRYTLAKFADGAHQYDFTFDLGVRKTCSGVAAMNIALASIAGPNVRVSYTDDDYSDPGGQPSNWVLVPSYIAGSSWNNSNINGNALVAFTSGYTARYWNIMFNGGIGAFTLGRLCLGVVTTLSGYSPSGGLIVSRDTRVVGYTLGGVPFVNVTGKRRRSWRMMFDEHDDSVRGDIDAIVAEPGIFPFMDAIGASYHVHVLQGQYQSSHLWGTPNVWQTQLEIEEAP